MIKILFIAAILRICFTVYGIFHDKNIEVKFTDIDYTVFTEAASYLTKGQSPYLTKTYKYTPALAYLLMPNIYLHKLFGKILFCILDLVVAIILTKILKLQAKASCYEIKTLIATFWLFNPFTVTISSRGNAESIQILFVVLTLLFIRNNQVILAGIFYGIAVHFKIYPIIYAIPLLFFIGMKHNGNHIRKFVLITDYLKYYFLLLVNLRTVLFGIISLLMFCNIGFIMLHRHGYEFIENTYLFHLNRKDFQHNFSAFFYILRQLQYSNWLNVVNRLAFLPQLFSILWFGVKYYDRIELACFLQTFAFVTFNKVCTSQYFIWYIGLFPLAYPYMKIPTRKCIQFLVVWLASQGIWLFLAYLLEFKKLDIAFYVWTASLLFLFTNIVLMYQFTKYAAIEEHKSKLSTPKYEVKRRPRLKKTD